MPLCPQCRSSYLEGEDICKQCGYRLAEGPGEKRYCPQCGTAVERNQNFCHECDAPLQAGMEFTPPGIREPVPSPPPPADYASPVRPDWQKWAFLAGGACLLVILLLVVVKAMRKPTLPPSLTPPATQRQLETRTAIPPAVAPPESEREGGEAALPPAAPSLPGSAGTQPQLAKVMENLRDANLKEDLILYLSCFSYVYPQIEKKRQEIQKTWKNFNFRKMVYALSEVNELGADDAMADVSWNMTVQNRNSQELDVSTVKYRVWFTKELGQWKIKKLEELSD